MFNKLREWKARRNAEARLEAVAEARARLRLKSRNLGAPLFLTYNWNVPNNNKRKINNARKKINNASKLNAARRVRAKQNAFTVLARNLSPNTVLLMNRSQYNMAFAHRRRARINT
jgi:hypothetical protein